jgi:hypothetical protein
VDIVEFLTARYDERWHAAEAADRTGHWDDLAWPESCGINGVAEEHVLAWSPKFVLADIAAKRAHIDLWREGLARMDAALERSKTATNDLSRKAALTQFEQALGFHEATVKVLCADAAVYAEHPDFDPAWRIS